MLLVAFVAYIGGLLPGRLLRRIDRRVFFANSRNEESRWRRILENVTLTLSDQQLVTGLAILIAGYSEMASKGIDFYHWGIVVYLAWLSSAVHIESLTVLRDIFNENPRLRNIRVVGMLALLTFLTTAMWPLRGDIEVASWVPVKCLWDQRVVRASRDYAFTNGIDLNWILSVIMLFSAYVWKLSQLFASSRGWVRKWLRAKPEVAQERLLRRIAKSNRNAWLKWPAQNRGGLLRRFRGLGRICRVVPGDARLFVFDPALGCRQHHISLVHGRRKGAI